MFVAINLRSFWEKITPCSISFSKDTSDIIEDPWYHIEVEEEEDNGDEEGDIQDVEEDQDQGGEAEEQEQDLALSRKNE